MEMPRTQFFIYLIIAQVIFGILIGLIPFFLGRSRNNSRMGNIGLLVSVIAAAVSPLASIVAVAIFSWLIVKKKNVAAATTDEHPADNS